MTVDKATAEYRSFREGTAYYFCSADCKKRFDADPGKYASTGAAHEGHSHA
jgi:Cu+-exporting ATPase